MSEIYAIAHALKQRPSEEAALATIVEARGSTYRRPGARLLIFEGGDTVGAISGGCLESDLIEYGRQTIESGDARLVVHEPTDDDVLMGTGLGCDGELRIVVEPVGHRLRKDLAGLLEGGRWRAILDLPESGVPGPTRVISERAIDELPFAPLLADRVTQLVEVAEGEIFAQPIDPPPSLVILGASPEAPALARFGRILGWRVTVGDHRPAFANATRFPEGVEIVVAPIEALVERLNPEVGAAVVLMTHNFLHDVALLEQLRDRDIAYLGLIGPAGRKEKLLAHLAGGRPLDPTIHGPAGLDIAAETPEEIALSIVSEIQAVARGGRGGFLSDLPGPIHRATRPLVRHPGVAVLVLAAGGSRRLGRPKQLLRIDGESLVERSVDVALSLGPAAVFVVVGAEEEAIREQLSGRPVEVVSNPEWDKGMSSSLAAGLAAVRGSLGDRAEAVLVSLCDQPGIDGAHLASLVSTWRERGCRAVGTAYPEGPGVPAVIDAALFDAIGSIEGDRGAREVLRDLGSEVVAVPFEDTGDIDSPDDLSTLERKPRT